MDMEDIMTANGSPNRGQKIYQTRGRTKVNRFHGIGVNRCKRFFMALFVDKKKNCFHCPNQASVAILTKGRSLSALIMKLVRRLTWCAAKRNFIIHAKHAT